MGGGGGAIKTSFSRAFKVRGDERKLEGTVFQSLRVITEKIECQCNMGGGTIIPAKS